MKKAKFSAIVVLGAMLFAACSSSPSASNSDNVSVPSLHADPSSASYQDGYAEGQRLVNNGSGLRPRLSLQRHLPGPGHCLREVPADEQWQSQPVAAWGA